MPNVRPISQNPAYCQGSYLAGSGSNPKSSVNPDQAYQPEPIVASIRADPSLLPEDKSRLEVLVRAAARSAPPLHLVTLRGLQNTAAGHTLWSGGDHKLSEFPVEMRPAVLNAYHAPCDIHTLGKIMSRLKPE